MKEVHVSPVPHWREFFFVGLFSEPVKAGLTPYTQLDLLLLFIYGCVGSSLLHAGFL